MYWSGLNYDSAPMAFLNQSKTAIYWAEQPLLGAQADLLITYEGASGEHPLRCPPGMWLHFDGSHFSRFERGPDDTEQHHA
jgi:hypothetical protein